jgi:hypothetical protein
MQQTNEDVAATLARVAELLDAQREDRYRVRSYWRAADAVRSCKRPVAAIYEEHGAAGLEKLKGIGPKLAGAIEEILNTGRLGILDRLAERKVDALPGPEEGAPPVSVLLALDEEYRAKAVKGQLPTIAPRLMNPTGEKWLPIMTVERDGWPCTVLFSNTERAHELGRTRDWVVIYYKVAGQEDQCTVVTWRSGPLRGRRVVRGREDECAAHYGVEAN